MDSIDNIGNWETGNRQPDDAAKIQMADIFGVSVDYLIGRTDNRESTTNNEDLKFALFGGAANITDAMMDEVRQFAEMVKLREEERKRREKKNETYIIHRTAARGGGVQDNVMTREAYDEHVKKVKELPDIHDPRL